MLESWVRPWLAIVLQMPILSTVIDRGQNRHFYTTHLFVAIFPAMPRMTGDTFYRDDTNEFRCEIHEQHEISDAKIKPKFQ